MIEIITFEDSKSYKGKTASDQLTDWSEGISKDQVISIQFHDEGNISVFYWNCRFKDLQFEDNDKVKTLIKETENWEIQKDDENRLLIISYFENSHYVDEVCISYDELNFIK